MSRKAMSGRKDAAASSGIQRLLPVPGRHYLTALQFEQHGEADHGILVVVGQVPCALRFPPFPISTPSDRRIDGHGSVSFGDWSGRTVRGRAPE